MRRPNLKPAPIAAAELKRHMPNAACVATDLYSIKFLRNTARCPQSANHSHGDRNPSLRYDRKKDRIFCASQNCFGEKGADAIELVRIMEQCSFSEAVNKLSDHYGHRAPIPDLASQKPNEQLSKELEADWDGERLIDAKVARENAVRNGFRIVEAYNYSPQLRKIRFEHESKQQSDKRRPEKTFRWEHEVAGSWYSGDGGLPKPLYVNDRYAERNLSGLILGVEGEGKVNAAGHVGFAAFSFKSITPEQAASLADCDVVLWPDNDSSGAYQAQAALEVIRDCGQVRTVRLLAPPPDLCPAGDIIDAIRDLGWDQNRIADFLRTATPELDLRATIPDDAEQRREASEEQPRHNSGNRSDFDKHFRCSEDGVFFQRRNNDGSSEWVKIAAQLEVAAETRDAGGSNWGRLLRWRDNEHREHRWTMPMELLSSDASAVRARLLGEGLPFITSNMRLRERFTEYLQTASPGRRAYCVSRVGWHGDTYVLPDEAFGTQESEEIFYQPANEAVHYWNVSGTAEEWREQVGRPCGGNSRLILAVSCAFAGPLLSIESFESGGIHFHGASSTGKTTALVVAGSVCGGGGQSGFLQSWRSTINGLEAVAEAHNDGTLFLDELAQVDPHEAAETAYMLANGQGKSRMTKAVSVRRKLNWRLLFVSAGEVTTAEHAASAGKRTKAGVDVRLLNISADAGRGMGMFENLHGSPSSDAFVQRLKEAAGKYYGCPFRAFVAQHVLSPCKAKEKLECARKTLALTVPAGASGQVRRAAERLVLIAAAGELATDWGLTGWRAGEATEAAQKCLQSWILGRGTAGDSDVEAGIQKIRAFLGSHGSSRFQIIQGRGHGDRGADQQIVRDRAGFRRRVGDPVETQYLLLPETFKSEICAGLDYRAVARELEKRGFLVREGKDLTIKPRLPDFGSSRVYCVRAAILEADEC